MDKKILLNIAAGKGFPLGIENLEKYFLISLDTMYQGDIDLGQLEGTYNSLDTAYKNEPKMDRKISMDAFSFMETCSFKFDEIFSYRFLEHVPKDKVLYFIYLLSTSVKKGGYVEIIVPDYEKLAKMLLEEDPFNAKHNEWEQHDIILTYELVNDPGCPHASIWTEARAKYYFELEKRFKVQEVIKDFKFDGRDIYLYFRAKRV